MRMRVGSVQVVVRRVHRSQVATPTHGHCQPVGATFSGRAHIADECGMRDAPRHADRLFGDGAGGGHVLVLAGDPGAGLVGCPKR